MNNKQEDTMTNTSEKRALVPKLRFPEFRDDWIPKKLGELGRFIGGGTPDKSIPDYWQGDIPWVSSSDIYEDNIHTIAITRFINKKSIAESATKIVPKGSVLFVSRIGTGKLAVNNKDVCTSQDFTNFIPIEIYNYFVGYFFAANKSSLVSLGQGTSIKGFTKSDLENFDLSLPSKSEQQKIADCLSSIDELITTQTQKLDTLKAHKKGLMQQLFPAEGETLPRLRFPDFREAGEWEEKSLKTICVMQAGKFVAASDIFEQGNGGSYPCYGGNRLRGYTKTHTHSGKYPLIGRQGALCGNVNLVNGQFHATEHAVVVTPRDGINVDWLFYALDLLNLNRFATGQAQPGLSVEVLEKVPCAVPKEEREQQKIADCLTTVDGLIAAQTQKLTALKTHKKGLMQQLFPVMDAKAEVEA